MKCPKCKADVSEDSHFCSKCGTPVKDTVDLSVSQTKTIQKPAISSGKTIAGKYKILEEIGRGGMGVVYRAEDIKLKRTVALKFLPPELIQDQEAKQRFIQEAQAAAALNHPNICTIYEVDESDDQMFISMEYIEGQTLKDKLASGPINIDEATVIATQVAQGLDKAHKKGIIHRDIKPANIMINDDGQAKITDFGLAKLSRGVDLTKTSSFMGTVAYMSPEQAKGEAVDHRTDIWSLGAMMYEMLAGERPFTKSSEHALIYSILNEEPQDLFTLRPDLPLHIQNVVQKALAKDADYRYADIQSLLQDLEPPLSINLPKTSCSIVVLPFDDMSPNKDNEYFSDGLTEEVISDLSQVNELCVISRNSAMALKGTKKNTKTIRKELNVQYVLEGSVRKAGNDLRITAQLIDATTDIHLWAEKYKGKLDDIFDIQEKVSRSIVDALRLELSPEENKKISQRPHEDVHAYECYMKARQEIYRWTEDSLNHALQILQNGLEVIGENADLYAGMALVYFYCFDLGIKPDEETLRKAEEFAKKVKKLKPDSHHYHYFLGRIERAQGSALKAIKHMEKALAIEPNDSETLMMQSYLISTFSGKTEIAEPYVKKLMEIDPLTSFNYLIPGLIHLFKGENELAIASIRKWSQMDPENRWAKYFLSRYLSWNGQVEESIQLTDQIVEENSQDLCAVLSLFAKYALQGEKDKALKAMTEEERRLCWNDPEQPWFMAGYFALINEKREALDWLEHAIDRGFINYPILNEKDPFLENIRGEPRFKKLMERVKQEWENFEV